MIRIMATNELSTSVSNKPVSEFLILKLKYLVMPNRIKTSASHHNIQSPLSLKFTHLNIL